MLKQLLKITLLFSCLSLLTACQKDPEIFLKDYSKIDLLIKNGQVLDGLGNEPFVADIVIVDNEIVFIGKSKFNSDKISTRINKVIDASGQFVSPGFIDLHSHGDPLSTPDFENFLAMGVTTITLGQDGSSPNVQDLSVWLDKVKAQGIAVNLAMFIGHGTLRTITGINQKTDPGPDEMALMTKVLDDALKYTFGMSTGLEYNPGLYAQQEELFALARTVGKNDRLIMSHIRNEDDTELAKSINELLDQGQFSRVHISHLKSVYGRGVDDAKEILSILSDARKRGIKLSADVYPYNASYAGLSLLFPVWAKTTEQFNQALVERREELEAFLKAKIKKRNGPKATLFGTAPYTGKTLADLSQELDLAPEQVLIKLGPVGVSGAYFIMDDELQSHLIVDSTLAISSDGSPTGFHPRGHGTFAKIIELYVNDRQSLALTEAIRKMSSLPASILGMTDRGSIQLGNKADIIIFNLDKVKAKASYPKPHQLAEGFDTVIVNGKIARENGTSDGARYGSVLKPN